MNPSSLSPGTLLHGHHAQSAPVDMEIWASMKAMPGSKGPTLLQDLIELYASEESSRLAELDRFIAERNGAAAGESAHGLGGNAATLGARVVRIQSLALEAALRGGSWDSVGFLRQQLDRACRDFARERTRLQEASP